MESLGVDFRDCPVIIYDNDGNQMGSTVVKEHDKREMTISVSELPEGATQGERLDLLIIYSGGAGRFYGTPRKSMGIGAYEIALFKEHEQYSRGAERFKLSAPALINNIVTNLGKTPLEPPVKVVVKDLSTNGMLIKAPPGNFKKGQTLEIDVNIQGKDVVFYGLILREQEGDYNTVSYGCKFVFPNL